MSTILVLNSGSSSVKFALYDRSGASLLRGQIKSFPEAPMLEMRYPGSYTDPLEGIGTIREAVEVILEQTLELRGGADPAAVGHRVVHGGPLFHGPAVLTARTEAAIRELIPLAPSHQPQSIAAIEAIREACPETLQTASFDTSFHRTQSTVAQLYALPRDILDRGVRRYGFHGLAYAYSAQVMESRLVDAGSTRIVAAHLGSGASLCAMRGGKSVATSMGFTALDGLPMATRCGDVDPGVLLFLMQQEGMNAEEVTRLLYTESGLKGLSGGTGDMAALLSHEDDARTEEAIAYFCHRVRLGIAEMTAAAGGIDALVFSGGVGENAARIRHRIVEDLGWLGLILDGEANDTHAARISAQKSSAAIYIVHTDEEEIIRQDTEHLLAGMA